MSAFLSLMAGCATAPPASSQARDLAMSFTPHPESAGVYIFRPQDPIGGENLIEISLDHISVGQLGNKSFLYLPVAPGEHRIRQRFGSFDSFFGGSQFTAEAGKNYFFVHSFLHGAKKITPITEGEGKAYAETFTLSSLCGPGWAEQYAAAQGGQASFFYGNVLPAMPVKTGVFYAPPTIRFWAPSGGIGVIQAGLMNNLGRRR